MGDKMKGKNLLVLIGKGSRQAFDEFYELYASFVLHIAYQVLRDRNEAEDVCHDIFLEIYQKPHEYKSDKGSVKAWLAVKTRSRSIDRLRKRQPVLVHKLEQLDTEDAVQTEISVLRHLEKKVILDALKHIPKKQREVIYGAYFEGKTQRELAETLNRPLGSIKSMVRYGLNNLRKDEKLIQWENPVESEKHGTKSHR